MWSLASLMFDKLCQALKKHETMLWRNNSSKETTAFYGNSKWNLFNNFFLKSQWTNNQNGNYKTMGISQNEDNQHNKNKNGLCFFAQNPIILLKMLTLHNKSNKWDF
jgi:hypothetical protein